MTNDQKDHHDSELCCLFLCAPTYAITLKCEKESKGKGIKRCTLVYLIISILVVLACSFFSIKTEEFLAAKNTYKLYDIYGHRCDIDIYPYILLFLWAFPFSRIIESVVTLTGDAFSHLGKDDSSNEKNTGFSPKERVLQLIKNYVDITMQFGFIFYLMQKVNPCFLKLPQGDTLSVFDAVYFSAVTITTLGYGDIAPIHWTAKLLVVVELFCGLLLIVMVFAIYSSQKDK